MHDCFSTAINAFYLEGISHRIRMHIAVCGFFIGYTLLSFAVYANFWCAIVAIVIIGGSASYGESVILGYLKFFPPKLSGGWSSGSGFAGFIASTTYLLFAEVVHFSNQKIFIVMIPTSILYMICAEISWHSPFRDKEVMEEEYKRYSIDHSNSEVFVNPLFMNHKRSLPTNVGCDVSDDEDVEIAAVYMQEKDNEISPDASPAHSNLVISHSYADYHSLNDESTCEQSVRCFAQIWYRSIMVCFYLFQTKNVHFVLICTVIVGVYDGIYLLCWIGTNCKY